MQNSINGLGTSPPVRGAWIEILEEVDTNELLKVSMDMIAVYDGPRIKSTIESQMSAARELLSKPEVKQLITAAQAVGNQK